MITGMTPARVEPRPHQVAAIEAVATTFSTGNRAQLRMACGTGKSLVAFWIAQRMRARTVVVFVPSIALVAQILTEWRRADPRLRTLAVCSDPSTAAGRTEIGPDGIDPFAGQRNTSGTATTHAEVVAGFLDSSTEQDCAVMSVVVATYHSAQVVADAFTLTGTVRGVDLVVADEAHHLAGRTAARFVPVLRDNAIPARWRLFQTATAVVVGRESNFDSVTGAAELARCMDDVDLFGPVAYTINVGDAIAAGLLADYRIVVTTPYRDAPADTPDRAALAALSDVIARYGIRRILTFHSRVAGAHTFARRVTDLGTVNGMTVRGFAVDGTMADSDRRAILDDLRSTPASHVTVVSSAGCLREGVDVPAVDAIVFVDPRASVVSIIQSIGRALRPHPDKTLANIVVPLVLDPSGDDQEQLADSAYRHIWRVLRGLRIHDDRVGHALDRAHRSAGASAGGDTISEIDAEWLTVLGDNPGAVMTRLLERTSATWEFYFGQLLARVAGCGSAAMITAGDRLGGWIVLQRILYRDEMIDPDRAKRLESVDGWRWESTDAADERTLSSLDAVVAEHGTVAENDSGTSLFTGHTDGLNRPLRLWVASVLFRYQDGTLSQELHDLPQRYPGWTWTPLNDVDAAGIAAFRSFTQWEGHADVPAGHVEDDVDLDHWLSGVRRRKILGSLPPMIESMLLAATPTGHKGTRAFHWLPGPTRWELGLDAVRSYLAGGGQLSTMPPGCKVLVDGHPVEVYSWMVRARVRYRKGEMPPEQIAACERFEGWEWAVSRAGHRTVQIEAPKPGVAVHDTNGYVAGCRCVACVTDQRRYTREVARDRRQAYRGSWVDAGDVRAHVQSLIDLDAAKDRSDAIFTNGAIAAAAGVPFQLVGALLRADQPQCHPLHHRALLALTADDVRAVRTEERPRGRLGIADRRPVDDPEPTWRFMDELVTAGWTRPQLSAALGYSSASHLPMRGQPLSASKAKLVAVFRDSLRGDLTPPTPPPPKNRGEGPPRRSPAAKAAVPAPPAVPVLTAGTRDVAASDPGWARSLLVQGYRVERIAVLAGLPVSAIAALADEFGCDVDREQRAAG